MAATKSAARIAAQKTAALDSLRAMTSRVPPNVLNGCGVELVMSWKASAGRAHRMMRADPRRVPLHRLVSMADEMEKFE